MDHNASKGFSVLSDEMEESSQCVSELCRVCARSSAEVISVFSRHGKELQLAEMIHLFLPIMVTRRDLLPQTVCRQCVRDLEACNTLAQKSIEADKELRDLFGFEEAVGSCTLRNVAVTALQQDKASCKDGSSVGVNEDSIDSNLSEDSVLDISQLLTSALKRSPDCVPINSRIPKDTVQEEVSCDSSVRPNASDAKLYSTEMEEESKIISERTIGKTRIVTAPTVSAAVSVLKSSSKIKNPKFKVYRVRVANTKDVTVVDRDQPCQTVNMLKRHTTLQPRQKDICPLCNYVVMNDVKRFRSHIESHIQNCSQGSNQNRSSFEKKLDILQAQVLKHITNYGGIWELDSALLSPDEEMNKILEEKSSIKFSSLNEEKQQKIVDKLIHLFGNDDSASNGKEISREAAFQTSCPTAVSNLSSDHIYDSSVNVEYQWSDDFGNVDTNTTQNSSVYESLDDTAKYVSEEEGSFLEVKRDLKLQRELQREIAKDSKELHSSTLKNVPNLDLCSSRDRKKVSCDVLPSGSEEAAEPLVCEDCGKLMSSARKLRAHKRMHTDWKCNECGKEFMKQTYFDRHITKHSSEKRHICQYCGSLFRLASTLRLHELKHFSSISCQGCHKKFQSTEEVADHKCDREKVTRQATLQCNICPKKFCKQESLKKHENSHREQSHLCETCGKWFKSCLYLRKHKEIHVENRERISKQVPCELCDKTFSTTHKLRIHMCRHKGERPFSCGVCGKAFSCKQTLRQHATTHGEANFPCPYCGRRFNRKGNLQTHIERHKRNTLNKTPYMCRICGERFSDRALYTSHCISHAHDSSLKVEEPTPCSLCNKVLANRNLLSLHMRRVHLGVMKDRPLYSCKNCSAQFTTMRSLKFHQYSHGEKPDFQCSTCSKVVLSKASLEAHERLHTGEKPFSCSQCSRSFSSQHSLYQHTRNVHVTDPPFKCKICGNKFKRAAALRIHQSTHSDERPYECDVCGSTFKTKGDRYTHRKRHPDAPPIPSQSFPFKPVMLESKFKFSMQIESTSAQQNVGEISHIKSRDQEEVTCAVRTIEEDSSPVVIEHGLTSSLGPGLLEQNLMPPTVNGDQHANCIVVQIIP